MRLALRDRREEIVSRHDRAYESDSSRATPAFRTAVEKVAEELEEIIRSSPEAESDPVELARTHRNAGQAYDDLARGGLRETIPLAVAHYEAAQGLLKGSGAGIERARLDANYANTLALQAGGNNLGLMEAAESRYEAALTVFEANGLDVFANQVREYLRMLRGQLVLARKFASMRERQKKLEGLMQQMKGADPFQAQELMAQARKVLGSADARGLVEDAVQQAAELTEKYKSQHPELKKNMSSLVGLQGQFAEMASKMAERTRPEDPDTAFNAKALDLLRKRLEDDQAKGDVGEGHAEALSGLIDRLGRGMSSGDSLDDLRKNASGIRDLMDEANEHAQARLLGELKGCGPAARRVYGGLSKMHFEVTRTSTDGTEEGAVRHELFQDMLEQMSYVRRQGLSEEAALEREATAWSLALKAQHFWRRHHAMVVEPLWDSSSVQVRPRRLFVAGDSFAMAVEEAASRLGVEVLPKLPSHGIAQGRWDQLRSCGVALFDFGDSGLQRAQTAYELGMALALGVPSAVFARGEVPFDVDLPVHQLQGAASDVDIVEAGIVEAVFTPVRVGQVDDPSALASQTLAHFEQKYGASLERSSGSVALRMVRDASTDSYAFARTMETVLRTANLSKPQVVRPAWPPYYADEKRGYRVCFHVTPFAPKFDEQSFAAERACGARRFRYVRHDMTKDPRIIRSLWREILTADLILVDLTDANPNVALELGLAHTVGKNVLMVAEDPVERFLYPSVRQVQTIKYTRGDNSFKDAVSRWLS